MTTINNAIARAESALAEYDEGPSPLHHPQGEGAVAKEFDAGSRLAVSFHELVAAVKRDQETARSLADALAENWESGDLAGTVTQAIGYLRGDDA